MQVVGQLGAGNKRLSAVAAATSASKAAGIANRGARNPASAWQESLRRATVSHSGWNQVKLLQGEPATDMPPLCLPPPPPVKPSAVGCPAAVLPPVRCALPTNIRASCLPQAATRCSKRHAQPATVALVLVAAAARLSPPRLSHQAGLACFGALSKYPDHHLDLSASAYRAISAAQRRGAIQKHGDGPL